MTPVCVENLIPGATTRIVACETPNLRSLYLRMCSCRAWAASRWKQKTHGPPEIQMTFRLFSKVVGDQLLRCPGRAPLISVYEGGPNEVDNCGSTDPRYVQQERKMDGAWGLVENESVLRGSSVVGVGVLSSLWCPICRFVWPQLLSLSVCSQFVLW